MIKNILKSLILLTCIQIASCAVLVKESDIQDYTSTLKTSREVVSSSKLKPNKIKNIAIFGFSSNLFSGNNSRNSIMGVNTGLINTITDAASNRGCIALDKTYDIAVKAFKESGLNIVSSDKLKKSKTYMSIGAKDFPGLCTSGDTRINVFPPEKEMNKLFDELKVDALVSFNVNAQDDQSSSGYIYVWTKGTEKAEMAWYSNLSRQIKVPSDSQMFFRDLQELSKSSDQKIALTAQVYVTAFKLLASRMIEDLK